MLLLLTVIASGLFLYGSYGLIELWATYTGTYTLEVALDLTFSGALFIVGGAAALLSINQWAKRQTRQALQAQHPIKPWLWRYDWLHGYSETQLHTQIFSLLFSLTWSILLIPVLLAKRHELTGMFYWVFGVLFPIVSASMLLNTAYTWCNYFRFGRNRIIFHHHPFKQGKPAQVKLIGSLATIQQPLDTTVQVIFNYIRRTHDHDGTTYTNTASTLNSESWQDSPAITDKQHLLCGTIPEGFADFGIKTILPEYCKHPGTIKYRLQIKSTSNKLIDYSYDLPVFSSLPAHSNNRKSGIILNNRALTGKFSLLLCALALLMAFNMQKIDAVLRLTNFTNSQESPTWNSSQPKDEQTLELEATSMNAVAGMNGATQFMLIARYKNLQQTQDAYHNGGDLNTTDDFGRTVIHHAVACHPNQAPGRTTAILDYLLSLDNYQLHETDASGRTPLYWAIDSACLEGVQALLAQGAQVSPDLITAATKERLRLHSRDNFAKAAVINSEKIEAILLSYQ